MADVLVVGGGSAGCVLAARLSEDPACEVTVLEAGPDLAGVADLPLDVVDASGPTVAHDWGYVAEPDRLGRCIALPRAKLIGGCSATNGCFALRGAPADYDGWAGMGNPGWSFGDVLPFFRRLEADADFGDQWHGTRGPVPVCRCLPAELNPVQAAFIEAACAYGLAYVADHNRPGAVGVGPMPRNARAGVRMSTALTYLAAARSRPNLTVRGSAMADRIEVRGGTAAGVRLASGEVVTAGRVVLAAGAYAADPIPGDARQNGLSAHGVPAARAEPGNLRAITRSFRPVSQQYGIDKVAHVPEHRSRCVTIAGCSPRARSADLRGKLPVSAQLMRHADLGDLRVSVCRPKRMAAAQRPGGTVTAARSPVATGHARIVPAGPRLRSVDDHKDREGMKLERTGRDAFALSVTAVELSS